MTKTRDLADLGGGFIQAGTGAQQRTVESKLQDVVSVLDFIPESEHAAIKAGTSTYDATADIQAAINLSCNGGGSVYLPAGTYKCGALTATARLKMYGDGIFKSIISSTVTGSNDAFTITPLVGSGNTGYLFEDFGIEPVIPGNGRYGIRVTLVTLAYFSNSVFHRVYIGQFGSQGLYLDNTIANGDGFFTTTIRRCWITNGILGTKVGDSINIEENTITGSANYVGISLTSLSGARQIIMDSNNITTLGGGIFLDNVFGASIKNNQIEYATTTINYAGSNPGYVTLQDCAHTNILGNTISPYLGGGVTAASSAIAILGTTTRTLIQANEIAKGQNYHISSEATTNKSFIYSDNNYNISPPSFDLLGTDTRGVWFTPTLINGWVNTGGDPGDARYMKTVDGTVFIDGNVSGGASSIFTLPAAYCPDDRRRFVTVADGTVTPAIAQVNNFVLGANVVPVSYSGSALNLEGIIYQAAESP